MEVDPPVYCFNCLGNKECNCPSWEKFSRSKCETCGASVRIFEKILKELDFNQLYGSCKACFPSKVQYAYDHEDQVWRCSFRRIHF